MTSSHTIGKAITTVMLAVAVAFPLPVAGQTYTKPPGGQAVVDAWTTGAAPATAQTVHACLALDICPEQTLGLDRRILFAVNGWDSRPARVLFGAADASAYPVFVAAPLVMWGGVLADRIEAGDAVRGTLALATGFSATVMLKRLVGRSRPYAAIDGFSARSGHTGALGLSDTASFPSGHATLAGIVATGAALLIRHPGATVAGGVWAASVSASRLWLGVHYPTDVAAGLAVGAGTTLLVMSIVP